MWKSNMESGLKQKPLKNIWCFKLFLFVCFSGEPCYHSIMSLSKFMLKLVSQYNRLEKHTCKKLWSSVLEMVQRCKRRLGKADRPFQIVRTQHLSLGTTATNGNPRNRDPALFRHLPSWPWTSGLQNENKINIWLITAGHRVAFYCSAAD